MPVYAEASLFELPTLYINGGRRGYLIGIAPDTLVTLLPLTRVHCALDV
jgi:prolyl-tRNA editing enzyme YbaK/EbsC (Cys-tRNA(Pro) deacylase)